jgi:hypothetical protein
MRYMRTLKLALGATVLSLLFVPAAGAAEPNDSFATATGPLTAGQTFKASLETATDTDFQFFYVPDPTTITVTTLNDAKSGGNAANRGRTLVSSILRGRKGKLPLPLAGTTKTLKPGQKGKAKVTLLPGKYFVPIGHADTKAAPLADVPFRIQITPAGTTTDSFEIFQARCQSAHRKLSRIKASIRRTEKRLAKAKHNGASSHKIVKLNLKLRDKRAKAKPAKKAEKFACSIPR